MINYYKILDLDNYASVEEVKEAYKAKIKQYHPDISQEEDAEEMTKYLNLAKDQLDSPENKSKYDRELKLAYLIEINRLQKKSHSNHSDIRRTDNSWRKLSKRQRKEKLDEARKIKIKEKYDEGIKKFPLWMRITGLSVLFLWSLQLIYSNFFIEHKSYDLGYAIIGYFLLAFVMRLASNEAYTRFTVKSLTKSVRFNFEKKIGLWFVLGFIFAVIAVNGLNFGRKAYLLENEYDYTTANILVSESSVNNIIVQYRVDNTTYRRQLNANILDIILLPNGKGVLKYATPQPQICELVLKGENVDFKNYKR